MRVKDYYSELEIHSGLPIEAVARLLRRQHLELVDDCSSQAEERKALIREALPTIGKNQTERAIYDAALKAQTEAAIRQNAEELKASPITEEVLAQILSRTPLVPRATVLQENNASSLLMTYPPFAALAFSANSLDSAGKIIGKYNPAAAVGIDLLAQSQRAVLDIANAYFSMFYPVRTPSRKSPDIRREERVLVVLDY